MQYFDTLLISLRFDLSFHLYLFVGTLILFLFSFNILLDFCMCLLQRPSLHSLTIYFVFILDFISISLFMLTNL